jgi:hypothetical protein
VVELLYRLECDLALSLYGLGQILAGRLFLTYLNIVNGSNISFLGIENLQPE